MTTHKAHGLPLAWLKGCHTPEEKAAREELVRNSTQFATLLLSILEDKYNLIERKGFNEDDYAEAGWITLQAFRNGKAASLTEIAELFSYLKGN